MKEFVGILAVVGSVGIGYGIAGGHFHVLWQPAELLIIWGVSIGAFVVANSSAVLSHTGQALKEAFSSKVHSSKDYMDLLCLQFILFKTARAKGLLALEAHIERPTESMIFQRFPQFLQNQEALVFLCDYFRLITMGSENVYQMEDLMDKEIEVYTRELSHVSNALLTMADGMPAIGIVAAVLGVIHTMGSINEPPEVLGRLIGEALVGTFAGVLCSYGLVGPLAGALQSVESEKVKFLECIKAGLVAYLHGHPPVIAVDYARKSIETRVRPTFAEMEESVQNITEMLQS